MTNLTQSQQLSEGEYVAYFSDREFGQRPATEEEIAGSVWEGFRAIINSRIEDGSFGVDFPENCTDGRGPFATNRQAFEVVMRAEIPQLPEEVLRYGLGGPSKDS